MGLIPPLAIIQAHLGSTRFPNKMLADLDGQPVVWHTWYAAVRQFGKDNVVLAVPQGDRQPFRTALRHAEVYGWQGEESDVLGRLHAAAHGYRTVPTAPIYRLTPDDWPPVLFRDRTTLAQLDCWQAAVTDPKEREHVGYLFTSRQHEINTPEDLDLVRKEFA